jgi:hypothetical protein
MLAAKRLIERKSMQESILANRTYRGENQKFRRVPDAPLETVLQQLLIKAGGPGGPGVAGGAGAGAGGPAANAAAATTEAPHGTSVPAAGSSLAALATAAAAAAAATPPPTSATDNAAGNKLTTLTVSNINVYMATEGYLPTALRVQVKEVLKDPTKPGRVLADQTTKVGRETPPGTIELEFAGMLGAGSVAMVQVWVHTQSIAAYEAQDAKRRKKEQNPSDGGAAGAGAAEEPQSNEVVILGTVPIAVLGPTSIAIEPEGNKFTLALIPQPSEVDPMWPPKDALSVGNIAILLKDITKEGEQSDVAAATGEGEEGLVLDLGFRVGVRESTSHQRKATSSKTHKGGRTGAGASVFVNEARAALVRPRVNLEFEFRLDKTSFRASSQTNCKCPWCSKDCWGDIQALLMHLSVCHSRMTYVNGVLADISVVIFRGDRGTHVLLVEHLIRLCGFFLGSGADISYLAAE